MVLRIAICGGGIGGLTAAHCTLMLCGQNVTVDVYEASAYEVNTTVELFDNQNEGLGLSLGPNALRVWSHVGLEKQFTATSPVDNSSSSHIWMRIRQWDTGISPTP